PAMVLPAGTAADVMTASPESLPAEASVREAIAFFTDRGFGGAPVVDEQGRLVGVVSRTDLVTYDREKANYVPAVPGGEEGPEGPLTWEARGFQVEDVDRTRVAEIMTPVVYSVRPDTPVQEVVERMLSLQVHRLFVVDGEGKLAGVITTLDILRHLRAGPA
ncbi:MAG TPA: CBS domain-containing protein, partial [Gemmataceae bacterium]